MIFLGGTLENYQKMKMHGGSETARKNQKLIIDPWTYMNMAGVFPESDFGRDASSQSIDLDGIKLRWYDRWLKGLDNGINYEGPIQIFVMGIDKLRKIKEWPLPNTI